MLAAGRDLSEARLSPDGHTVVFVSSSAGRNALIAVPVDGGPERRLSSVPEPRAGRLTSGGVFAWVPDGSALVYVARDGDLWVQPVVGGPPRLVTQQPKGQAAAAPTVAPDGRRVAYVVDDRHVAVTPLDPHDGWPTRLSAPDAEFSFDPSWSADGAFVAWHAWRPPAMAWDESVWMIAPVDGGPERRLTSVPEPRAGRVTSGGVFDWLPDATALVYVARDGDLWLQPVAGGPPRRVTQQAKGQAAAAPAVAPDGRRVAYVVDDRHVAVAPLDPHDGWPTRLSAPDAEFSFDPSWSADGAFVTWHSWRPPAMAWDESVWTIAPADGSGPVAEMGGEGVAVQQPRFAPVGSDLAYLCDRRGWMNLWLFGEGHDAEAALVDEPFEHGEPTWGQGQRSFAWSPDGAAIAFCRNEAGFGRLCVVDVATRAVRDVAKAVHGVLSWRGTTLVALRSGATTPTQLVAYDAGARGEGTWSRRVLAVGPVAGFEPHLVEPEAITFPGTDGGVVHGRLYRPAGASGPTPCLLWIHGGPTSQWQVAFNARVAYWLAHGWSVLFVDHRGSTGFGRAYAQALIGRWGELDSDDAAVAATAALDRGWARPDALVAMGGSAGGLTVLNLLRRRPGLVAAGVVLYPVTDLRALDHATHRFEAHYNGRLVGPWPAAAASYRERSPLFDAAAIAVPLLVLHGDDDDVVPVEQSRALVASLRAAGRTVTFHVYEGQGHGWSDPAVVADELERTVRFLADLPGTSP